MPRNTPDHPVFLDRQMIMARAFGNRIRLAAIPGPAPAKVDLLQANKVCLANGFGDGFQRVRLGRCMKHLPVRPGQIV